ncbi:PREDICTED: uncharacterized protein LOC109588286 [Amphimedon queenslandica]|uniref:Death domain-containing protein n=1 Tax=Amphimedon queenslandica TaxID=400682 RepID=A0AAN0JSD2_AMPQE|nr:PREDICTED: uncharacterized protein LOC109588286 [Amphimedon queenslandica]|eukprot:XP_019860013.1 PREDICTED: uncharacterized protein LOC109588286 [Amphimedon queenslandica]
MERMDQSRSLDDKKTTLLTAIQETVSSDHRKFKDIAMVLSDVKETRDIANKMMTEYEQEIPEDDDSTSVVQPQEVEIGNEDYASDILRNNYSALSQSITEPVRMARLLHEEVISDEALSCVMSTRGSVSDSRAVLLKAVRDAVHSNYKHLELFVTVLRKFSKVTHIGDAIFEEYKALFPEGDIVSELHCHHHLNQSHSEEETSSASSVSVGGPVYFPSNMDPEFSSLRCKFGSAFYAARCAIEKKNIDPLQMRMLLSDCFPHKPEFANKSLKNTHDIVDIVKRNCNLIDINCLEVLVMHFDVSEAVDPLEAYKAEVQEFCKVLRDELNESLEVVRSPRSLSRETIVLVLDQTPLTCTVGDVKDVVRKASGAHIEDVRIMNISDSHSIAITCFVPMSLTGYVITTVLQNIKDFQSKGLRELILNDTIIWKINDHRQEASTETDATIESRELLDSQLVFQNIEIEEENRLIDDKSIDSIEKLKEQLQAHLKIKKMMGFEIERLKTKLASLKELSDNRLKEIEQLKLKLEDSNKLQVEEISETFKDELSDSDTLTQEAGDVKWSHKQHRVHLTKASVDECKDVISQLNEEHRYIVLRDLSSDSIRYLMPNILKGNKIQNCTIYSFLARDDILSFSPQLSTNESLTSLQISHSSINDDGVVALVQPLKCNKNLQYLYLYYNPDITSACTKSLAELLLTNSSLIQLHLHRTGIDMDGVTTLIQTLKTNNTLKELWLDKKHKKNFTSGYDEKRIKFCVHTVHLHDNILQEGQSSEVYF